MTIDDVAPVVPPTLGEVSHVAFVVPDLDQAMAWIGSALGLTWATVCEFAGAMGPSDGAPVRATWSVQGTPHVELIGQAPGTIWSTACMHHVGLWSDDLAADVARYEEKGFVLEYTIGGHRPAGLAYVLDAEHGTRVELTDSRLRAAFDHWLAGGEFTVR